MDHIFRLPHKDALGAWFRSFLAMVVDATPQLDVSDFETGESLFTLSHRQRPFFRYLERHDYKGSDDILPGFPLSELGKAVVRPCVRDYVHMC